MGGLGTYFFSHILRKWIAILHFGRLIQLLSQNSMLDETSNNTRTTQGTRNDSVGQCEGRFGSLFFPGHMLGSIRTNICTIATAPSTIWSWANEDNNSHNPAL